MVMSSDMEAAMAFAENFEPLQDWVLVLLPEKRETTPGGIVMPDGSDYGPPVMEVLAAGPGVYENGKLIECRCQPGDQVVQYKPEVVHYQPMFFHFGKVKLMAARERDLVGFIKQGTKEPTEFCSAALEV